MNGTEKNLINTIFNQIQQLSYDAHKGLMAILGQQQKEDPKEISDQGLEHVLYDAIKDQFYASLGVKLRPFQSIHSKHFRYLLREAVNWLLPRNCTRSLQLMLFKMAAEAIVSQSSYPPQDEAGYERLLSRIATCVELAYPGYRRSGLLTKIALARSQGSLKQNTKGG